MLAVDTISCIGSRYCSDSKKIIEGWDFYETISLYICVSSRDLSIPSILLVLLLVRNLLFLIPINYGVVNIRAETVGNNAPKMKIPFLKKKKSTESTFEKLTELLRSDNLKKLMKEKQNGGK